nr:RNA-directed DNA polymerase [Xanthomonas sp. CFBP 8151]
MVGYNGFRSVTQIDPIWNLYLLSLVIWLGGDIEQARVKSENGVVHSYRFISKENDSHIFDSAYGWFSFYEKCQKLADSHRFVLITDISDFYPRIYHHRLENALKKVTKNTSVVKRIITIISHFSGNVSYGLPVGGPAARLLSEIVLNATDRMMLAERAVYCRFVDDFRIFADSREQAHALLVTLAQKIGESEGLSLQKSKTRIMSSEEYLAMTSSRGDDEHDGAETANYKKFMSLKLHFDPYSESAKEDYESLREALARFDVVGMLSRELRKTQVEESVTRKLVRSIRHLKVPQKNSCIQSLAENLETLAPVFPVVMQAFTMVSDELDLSSKEKMVESVKALFHLNSHIVQVPVNQLFAMRALSATLDEEVEQILNKIYRDTSSISVRRDVIALMANRDHAWFISDRRRNYQNLSSWEKRAVLVASYILEDEGEHWRKRLVLNEYEKILVKWASLNKSKNKGTVVLPL